MLVVGGKLVVCVGDMVIVVVLLVSVLSLSCMVSLNIRLVV